MLRELQLANESLKVRLRRKDAAIALLKDTVRRLQNPETDESQRIAELQAERDRLKVRIARVFGHVCAPGHRCRTSFETIGFCRKRTVDCKQDSKRSTASLRERRGRPSLKTIRPLSPTRWKKPQQTGATWTCRSRTPTSARASFRTRSDKMPGAPRSSLSCTASAPRFSVLSCVLFLSSVLPIVLLSALLSSPYSCVGFRRAPTPQSPSFHARNRGGKPGRCSTRISLDSTPSFAHCTSNPPSSFALHVAHGSGSGPSGYFFFSSLCSVARSFAGGYGRHPSHSKMRLTADVILVCMGLYCLFLASQLVLIFVPFSPALFDCSVQATGSTR